MRTIIETGLFLSGGFLISILQGLILIPNILLISYKKRLFDQPRLPHHPAEGDENRAKFVDCGHDFRDPGALPRGLFRFGWHHAAFRLHLAIGWRPVHHRAGFEFQLAVV